VIWSSCHQTKQSDDGVDEYQERQLAGDESA